MSEIIKPMEKKIIVHEISIIRQVIENRRHPLDMVREQLSNMCAKEVDAENIKVYYGPDPQYNASFIFEDDGCGMNYTGDPSNPGRLDRFIDLGFAPIVGFKGDEFSWKGLGSKLAFNCQRLEIETWTKDKEGYRAIIDKPYEKLTKEPPEIPKAQIYKLPSEDFRQRGTILKILGYENGRTDRDYSFDNIKNFLLHRTIIGCTRERKLPKITLKVLDREEVMETGYPFITKKEEDEWRTVVIDPPIQKTGRINDTEVKVTLKGGFTLTGKAKEFSMTSKNRNIGIILSAKGIPYFELDYYEFRGNLDPMRKMCNIIVECDELFDIMDLARGDYRREDGKAKAFEKALKEAISEFINQAEYKKYLDKKGREEQKKRSEILNERKNKLISGKQRYVFMDGMDSPIHREPENENDTLAVLWKLEGAKKLPFVDFKTLEHTSTYKGGIDLIAHLKEDEAGEKKTFVSIEVEHTFESFEEHHHYPAQTSYVFCWKISDTDILEKARERYKYFKIFDSHILQVFEISQFPGISTRAMESGTGE